MQWEMANNQKNKKRKKKRKEAALMKSQLPSRVGRVKNLQSSNEKQIGQIIQKKKNSPHKTTKNVTIE